MADKRHTYSIRVDWTGNQGTGTSAYRAYSRAHEISAQGKTAIGGSSDPVFRGDAARWTPAELLIAALSACHQLWYLHLCADAGIVVVAYSDDASGVEIEQADGAGQFESVTLRPQAKLAPGSDENVARRLHDAAAARKKLRLALLMTDDGTLATRLRTLVEKYRVRALIAEQRVLEVPSAPPEAVDPTDLPEWTRNDRWK